MDSFIFPVFTVSASDGWKVETEEPSKARVQELLLEMVAENSMMFKYSKCFVAHLDELKSDVLFMMQKESETSVCGTLASTDM